MIGHFNHLLGKQDVIEMSKTGGIPGSNQINPHFLYNTLEAIRDASEGALGIAQPRRRCPSSSGTPSRKPETW